MSDVWTRIRFAAAVLGLALGTSGRGGADVVISDLSNPSGGYGQADAFGQSFINGTVAEVIQSVQIEATFGAVPGNPSR